MTPDELEAENSRLQKRNAKLKAENARLRSCVTLQTCATDADFIIVKVYDDDDNDDLGEGPIHPRILFEDFLKNPEAYRVELVEEAPR